MHTSAGGMTSSNPTTVSELQHSVMKESATSAVACSAGQRACHQYDTTIQHTHTMLRGEDVWLDQQEVQRVCAACSSQLVLCLEVHLAVVLYPSFLKHRGWSNQDD